MGSSHHPFMFKGALIQISELMLGFVPNMIFFQYNPENLARTIQTVPPDEPEEGTAAAEETDDDQGEATNQPTHPRETISLTLELDATDDLEDPRGLSELAPVIGVADRIAALEMLTYPQESGALTSLVAGALGDSNTAFVTDLQKAPIVLFFWGVGRVVPVRITSMSITEKIFNAYLQPEHASVKLTLRVLRPDEISNQSNLLDMSVSEALAVGAYTYTLGVKEGLALVSTADEILDLFGAFGG